MAKSPFEIASLIAQECISHAPVLILGSGASAAYGIPGMPGLRGHLLKIPLPESSSNKDTDAWKAFTDELKKTDLESALTNVRLPDHLTRFVVEATWDLLAPFDFRLFDSVIRQRGMLPLTRLYKHLLQSTRTYVDVITPNYDRIAEYAADVAEISHFSGFGYGHLRLRTRGSTPRLFVDRAQARCVNIWKVHGSFDWFRDADGVVVALPVWMNRPSEFEPVMVTPGIEKYRLTHDEPFLSIKQGADVALQSARAYLCVGYGFNDTHIQTKLVERCNVDSIPFVLLTKEISGAAKAFLSSGKCKRYLALEESGENTRMFSAEYPEGVDLEKTRVWNLADFLTMVIP